MFNIIISLFLLWLIMHGFIILAREITRLKKKIVKLWTDLEYLQVMIRQINTRVADYPEIFGNLMEYLNVEPKNSTIIKKTKKK